MIGSTFGHFVEPELLSRLIESSPLVEERTPHWKELIRERNIGRSKIRQERKKWKEGAKYG